MYTEANRKEKCIFEHFRLHLCKKLSHGREFFVFSGVASAFFFSTQSGQMIKEKKHREEEEGFEKEKEIGGR